VSSWTAGIFAARSPGGGRTGQQEGSLAKGASCSSFEAGHVRFDAAVEVPFPDLLVHRFSRILLMAGLGPDGAEHRRSLARKVDAERFLATAETDKLHGEWIDPRLGRRRFGDCVEEYERSRVHLHRNDPGPARGLAQDAPLAGVRWDASGIHHRSSGVGVHRRTAGEGSGPVHDEQDPSSAGIVRAKVRGARAPDQRSASMVPSCRL
jgi:hypothetical protein